MTGDGENEIISSVAFDVEPTKDGNPLMWLLFGSENGNLYITTALTFFTVAVLAATLYLAKGITRIMTHRNPNTLIATYMVSMWAAAGGAFFYAVAGLANWQLMMQGLPPNALISMFTSYLAVSTLVIVAYVAMYGNSKEVNSGSEIYKTTFDINTGTDLQPYNDQRLTLFQNIPNPFKEQTRINFELPETGMTSLKIFDLAGNEIRSLVNGVAQEGRHSINVTKEGLRSGIYYYVLRSNNLVQTKKLVIQ